MCVHVIGTMWKWLWGRKRASRFQTLVGLGQDSVDKTDKKLDPFAVYMGVPAGHLWIPLFITFIPPRYGRTARRMIARTLGQPASGFPCPRSCSRMPCPTEVHRRWAGRTEDTRRLTAVLSSPGEDGEVSDLDMAHARQTDACWLSSGWSRLQDHGAAYTHTRERNAGLDSHAGVVDPIKLWGCSGPLAESLTGRLDGPLVF